MKIALERRLSFKFINKITVLKKITYACLAMFEHQIIKTDKHKKVNLYLYYEYKKI